MPKMLLSPFKYRKNEMTMMHRLPYSSPSSALARTKTMAKL